MKLRQMLVWLVVITVSSITQAAEPLVAKAPQRPILIRCEGVVSPLMEQFLLRKLASAQQQQSDLIILEIDSPGGFGATAIAIADHLRDIEWARTVAFVPKHAISAAAIISLACDDIVIATDGVFGDAGVIQQGEDNAYRYVSEKERSVLVRYIRDLAESKGRSPALAEAMMDMDLVVYRVRNRESGEDVFLSQAELDAVEEPEQWEKIAPLHESREKHFLTLNGKQAVDLKLAAATADSRDELRGLYRIDESLPVLKPTAVDTAVTILNLSIVTGLLFVIGLIALYVEFSAPGIGAGGLIAGLCFSLFFWSRFLGGTAGWLEVILFLAGIVFLGAEFFVIPGFGIAGLSGVLLIICSLMMASQHFVIPSSTLEWQTSIRALSVVFVSGFVFLAAAVMITRNLGTIPVLGSLILKRPSREAAIDTEDAKHPPASDAILVQVGDWGIADSPLRPAGMARFGEEYVDVVADGMFVDAGRQVRVIAVRGNRIIVREVA